MSIKEILKGLKGIIFQMLVADISEIILLEHEREIAHLHDPHALRVHNPLDIRHELVRILQVVKHRNGGDYSGTSLSQVWVRQKGICVKESDQDFVRSLS